LPPWYNLNDLGYTAIYPPLSTQTECVLTGELLWVVTLLVIAMVLFARNTLRMDIVALLVIIAFVLSGTLTINEALAGFSDPNVILSRTGKKW